MERWEIKPLVSVGEIKIGMNRDEVHKLLGQQHKEFKKNKFSKNTTDDYGRFHVFYTTNNMVDAIEFFEGIELVLDGKVIFPIKTDDIEKMIPGIVKDGNSYTNIEESIGIEAEDTMADSILIGSKGYYE